MLVPGYGLVLFEKKFWITTALRGGDVRPHYSKLLGVLIVGMPLHIGTYISFKKWVLGILYFMNSMMNAGTHNITIGPVTPHTPPPVAAPALPWRSYG